MPSCAKAWSGLPGIARFLLCHATIGFGVATLFVAAFLLANPHGGVMLAAAGHWWPAVAMWLSLGLFYALAQIGIGTMTLGDRPAAPRGGSRAPAGLVPIAVRVRAARC